MQDKRTLLGKPIVSTSVPQNLLTFAHDGPGLFNWCTQVSIVSSASSDLIMTQFRE